MRTKTTLVAAAALIAAGVATSMAQSNVYSLNIVGYVVYTQAAGTTTLAANPLNLPNNDVANVFPLSPTYYGTTVYKRNIAGSGYDSSEWSADLTAWDPALDVPPGTGLWISAPVGTPFTNVFVGEVILNSTNPIPAGYSLKGAILPQAGSIQTALNYQPGFGDQISEWNGTGYDTAEFSSDTGDWDPAQPDIAVAQGFWVNNAGAAKNWIRNFTP